MVNDSFLAFQPMSLPFLLRSFTRTGDAGDQLLLEA